VAEPGCGRVTSTRNTRPRGIVLERRPVDRASISAAVLPAAERARARSNSADDDAHVVRLTLPSTRPLPGSRTGTAAQVKVCSPIA